MGKPTIKTKKKQGGAGSGGKAAGGGKHGADRSAKAAAIDEDTAFFISMAQELKDEGHKLFQKRDHEGAMLKYEKAVKLLPRNHIDVASLRSNMAACYMQLGIGEYPHAIRECNLALEVAPKYSKALLRRAKCYEGLNKVELALRDVNLVLGMEPGNSAGLEMAERLRTEAEKLGVRFDDKEIDLGVSGAKTASPVKNKALKKGGVKAETESAVVDNGEVVVDKGVVESVVAENGDVENEKVESGGAADGRGEDEVAEDKEVEVKVVDENVSALTKNSEVVTKAVKLLFGEDIRCAQYPANSSIAAVRDIVKDKFPNLEGILIKYKDSEGDLVTITTTQELRLAESSGNAQGSFRLYVVEVRRDQEPVYERHEGASKGGEAVSGPCIDDWVIQFAQLFKNHVGLDADPYVDFHELGMELYAEALEDAVTTEDAQGLFEIAGEKFQEMAALAMFNWGNVHMSRARKWEPVSEDGSKESMLEQIKAAYDWAQKEYKKAAQKYEEAISIKPNFYEGYLALGRQQFEQAKLAWYYAVANKVELETGPSSEVILLYNQAEDSMERGMLMWEELEERRLNGISKFDEDKAQLQKMGLDKLIKNVSPDEDAEQAASMKSQIYILWGTLLYERSIVEYKLSIPVWEECLEVAVEKFELAGASPTDIAVMVKNHISNRTSLEGLGFKIDEIVQAWNEMHEAKKWQVGLPSFRLEPLFRRRIPRLHEVMEKL
uniref:PB1 domain-containing protein n=1 Tax=Kalanchoe fedtschenkoi TaxID=63787 RepID=A0A7N0TA91_KALFE